MKSKRQLQREIQSLDESISHLDQRISVMDSTIPELSPDDREISMDPDSDRQHYAGLAQYVQLKKERAALAAKKDAAADILAQSRAQDKPKRMTAKQISAALRDIWKHRKGERNIDHVYIAEAADRRGVPVPSAYWDATWTATLKNLHKAETARRYIHRALQPRRRRS